MSAIELLQDAHDRFLYAIPDEKEPFVSVRAVAQAVIAGTEPDFTGARQQLRSYLVMNPTSKIRKPRFRACRALLNFAWHVHSQPNGEHLNRFHDTLANFFEQLG